MCRPRPTRYYALVTAGLFVLTALFAVQPLVVQPVRAQSTIEVSPGGSAQDQLQTCPQLDSGNSTGMDVQASASGDAADWTSPTSVDFGYVAYGNCGYQTFTVTVPDGTPSGDYGLTWTFTCQLVGEGGTCTGGTVDYDVEVLGGISSTTTTVSCSPDPITTSGYATCDVSVSGSQANPPTGEVSFSTSSSTGSFSPSECDVSSGSCSVSYSDATLGSYTIIASYPGDDNNQGSSGSTAITVTGETSPTTTTVSCTPDPMSTTDTATCTASVSGSSSNPPTGVVDFTSSDESTGYFSPDSCDVSSGSCSASYTDTTPGTYTITASYPGDASNDPSSGSTSLTVASTSQTQTGTQTQAGTSTTVACSPDFITTTEYSTCTASVSSSGQNPPSGNVEFGTSSGTGNFEPSSCDVSSGSCSVSYDDPTPGSYTITATYSGDDYNQGSSGSTGVVVTEVTTTSAQQAQTTSSVSCSPVSVSSDAATTCTVTVSGNSPTGLVDFYTTSTDGTFDPESCSLSGGSCSVQYTDGQNGQPTITVEYEGNESNLGSQGATTVTVIGGQQEQSCTGFYLSEGLAPAASTTGDDNIYINVHWGGQIPSGGLSVELGAFPRSQDITADFAFNPITMFSASSSVLMDINTQGAPDGNYVVAVAAQTTDPQTGDQCNVGINADVTVSATSVFVQTTGGNQAEDIWLSGLSSPFQVSGEITASQYSSFVAHLDQNGHLASLTFTLTGPTGTDATGTIAIPKSLIPPGYVPELLIDGQQVQTTVTQDSTNFYITHTTHFSVHQVQLLFVQASTTTTSTSSLLGIGGIENTAAGLLIVIGLPAIAIAWIVLIVKRGKTALPKTPSHGPTSSSSGTSPALTVPATSKAHAPPPNAVASSPPAPQNTAEASRASAPTTQAIPRPGSVYGFCRKCGQPLDQNDKFCGNCGASLS